MSNNDRFIWDSEDIEIVSAEEFANHAVIYGKNSKVCTRNPYCKVCDETQMRIARQISHGIFSAFFEGDNCSEMLFRRVMKNLSALCKQATDKKIVLTKELYYCIKVQLVAEIQERTSIQIAPEMLKDLFS